MRTVNGKATKASAAQEPYFTANHHFQPNLADWRGSFFTWPARGRLGVKIVTGLSVVVWHPSGVSGEATILLCERQTGLPAVYYSHSKRLPRWFKMGLAKSFLLGSNALLILSDQLSFQLRYLEHTAVVHVFKTSYCWHNFNTSSNIVDIYLIELYSYPLFL